MSHNDAAAAAAGVGILAIFVLIWLALVVFVIAGMWKMFTKAGKPGWAAIVPIYNIIVLLEIAGKPLWWILLYFVPLVNVIISIMVLAALARNFGRGVGTVLGLIFLPMIFYPVIGFGSARYVPIR